MYKKYSTFSDILQEVKTYCFANSYHSLFESFWNSITSIQFKPPNINVWMRYFVDPPEGPAGCDFVRDGRSMPPALTDHPACPGLGLIYYWKFLKHRHELRHARKACPGTLVGPCLLFGLSQGLLLFRREETFVKIVIIFSAALSYKRSPASCGHQRKIKRTMNQILNIVCREKEVIAKEGVGLPSQLESTLQLGWWGLHRVHLLVCPSKIFRRGNKKTLFLVMVYSALFNNVCKALNLL